MIIHHAEPCISCEHYSPDDKDDNHWVCDFDHDTCPHIEALHKAVGYKKRIDAEVLDKIKADIDEQYDRVHPYNISCAEGLEMALNIIDKYRESIGAGEE